MLDMLSSSTESCLTVASSQTCWPCPLQLQQLYAYSTHINGGRLIVQGEQQPGTTLFATPQHCPPCRKL